MAKKNQNITEEVKEIEIDTSKIEEELEFKLEKNLKDKLNDYLEKEVSNLVKKTDKKLLRQKNIKILIRDVIIILLLALDIVVCYRIVNGKEVVIFNKHINGSCSEVECEEKTNTETNEKEKYDLNAMVEKYGYLLDRVKYSNNDYNKFYGDYKISELSNETKLVLATSNLKSDKIVNNYGIITIKNGDIKDSFNEIFGDKVEYSNDGFDYLNTKLTFNEEFDSYIGIYSENDNEYSVVNKITYIKEEEDTITISVLCGLFKDDNYYKFNEKKVSSINDLELYLYEFKKSNDSYIFNGITKE